MLRLSIKQKLLIPTQVALLILVLSFTAFWASRYSDKLYEGFETEYQSAKSFIKPSLVEALWDYNTDLIEKSISGLSLVSSFQFARVISGDDVMAELSAGEAWDPSWDELIAQLNVGEDGGAFVETGSIRIYLTPLLREDGEQIGILLSGWTPALIRAEIRTANQLAAAIGVVAFLCFGVMLYGISLSVTRPLQKVLSVISQLQAGDTAFENDLSKRSDEIGLLGQALDSFRDTMIETERLEADRQKAEEAQQKLEKEREDEKRKREAEARDAERETERLERERMESDRLREKERAARNAARMEEQQNVVSDLGSALYALSQGDLNKRITTNFPSEYEALRTDYNNAVESLSRAIGAVKGHSNAIHNEASDISQAADSLSRRTEKQAATLEETAAALDQMTASVKLSAKGANDASDTATAAQIKAKEGSKIAADAMEAMNGIKVSSEQISSITSVIDDIAFQTNLLALNAGVEAARAGDAGRGFAVVATEVRALAQRSAEAAREISSIVSSSTDEVSRGVDLVQKTGTALDHLSASVVEISNRLAEISASAKEQSTGLFEINTAANELDRVTQQNAAMFEETTAASFSLTSEAEALSKAVAQFKLKAEELLSVDDPSLETQKRA